MSFRHTIVMLSNNRTHQVEYGDFESYEQAEEVLLQKGWKRQAGTYGDSFHLSGWTGPSAGIVPTRPRFDISELPTETPAESS